MASSSNRVALVGGCGYVGKNLSVALSQRGWTVLVLDVVSPSFDTLSSNPKILYKTLDVAAQGQELVDTFIGFKPSIVISIVGWGMSGPDMLDKRCHFINVGSTENILRACQIADVTNIIYTSTYNVVFGGHEIEDGNEHLPYFPEDDHTDEYSKSKAIAEKLILQANGSHTNAGHVIRTSVIRPAAIYGEGEQRHLPRVVKHIDNGLFLFIIGHAVVDWVYIDNLVQAFVNLVDKLVSADSPEQSPAGQAYFISDGTPIENFDFFMPLVHARGRRFPKYELTTHAAHNLSWLLEDIYWLSMMWGNPIKPMLTRAEVFKVGVTHYFSIQKARNELGYTPTVTSQEGAERIAQYYKGSFSNDNFFSFAPVLLGYLPVIAGMTLLAIAAFRNASIPYGNSIISTYLLAPNEALGLKLFGSQTNLQHIFYGAVAVHLVEGSIAYNLASNFCKNTKWAWFWQTVLLGFPSLNILLQRVSKKDYMDMNLRL